MRCSFDHQGDETCVQSWKWGEGDYKFQQLINEGDCRKSKKELAIDRWTEEKE